MSVQSGKIHSPSTFNHSRQWIDPFVGHTRAVEQVGRSGACMIVCEIQREAKQRQYHKVGFVRVLGFDRPPAGEERRGEEQKRQHCVVVS